MERFERRQWIVGTALFFVVLIVFGAAYYSPGVFLLPLSKQFHWSRAGTSLLFTISALAGAVGNIGGGWLLDRVRVKSVMAVGVALTGLALLMASWANSFTTMTIAYALMGAGVNVGTLLPAVVLITRWFDKGRSTVMGIVIAGESAGGMIMVMLASRVLTAYGWRAAYVALAIPTLVLAIPIILGFVNDSPVAEDRQTSRAVQSVELEGLDVLPALKTRSFWLIGLSLTCCTFGLLGEITHVIPGLIGAGYTAAAAASIWGIALVLKSLGQLGFGVAAEWISARIGWALSFEIGAVGAVFLTLVRFNHLAVIPFIVLGGSTLGVSIVLAPVVLAESLGRRRFGSLQGLIFGTFSAAGSILGPVVVGKIYDTYHSYELGYLLIAVLFALAGIMVFCTVPLSAIEAESGRSAATAAD